MSTHSKDVRCRIWRCMNNQVKTKIYTKLNIECKISIRAEYFLGLLQVRQKTADVFLLNAIISMGISDKFNIV